MRRTVDQTRDLLLRAGVELLAERAQGTGDGVVAAALAHVRATEVARRATALVRAESGATAAAVTTGAMYNLWPSQADYQADLLFHVAEGQAALRPGLDESLDRFAAAATAGVPLPEVVRGLVEEVFAGYCDDPVFRIELGFLISAADPRVREALRHRQERFTASAELAWQGLLDAYGLRPRTPWQVRDLTVAIAAQVVGAVVLWHANPAVLADPAGEPGWTLVSRGVVALVTAHTEPSRPAARP